MSGGSGPRCHTKTSSRSSGRFPSHTPLSLRIPITLQNKQEAIVIKNKDQVCSSIPKERCHCRYRYIHPPNASHTNIWLYIIQSECSRIPRLIWKPKVGSGEVNNCSKFTSELPARQEMFSHLAFKSSRYFAAFLHTPALYFSAFCSRVMTWYKCGGKTSTGRKGRTRKKTQCLSLKLIGSHWPCVKHATSRSQGLRFWSVRPLLS